MGEIESFYAPDINVDTIAQFRRLLLELNRSLDSANNLSVRESSITQVQKIGENLFHNIFGLSSIDKDNSFLDEVICEKLRNSQDGPLEIILRGKWQSFPWELIRIPAGKVKNSASFLGELAIISSRKNSSPSASKRDPFIISGCIEVVSLLGDDLKHAELEIQGIKNLTNEYISEPRVVRELKPNKTSKIDSPNYRIISADLNDPRSPDFLHGAFHSKADVDESSFHIRLNKNANLVSEGFRRLGVRPARSNIAFFNSCHGISTNERYEGGIGTYANLRWGSDPVIASLSRIDDKEASKFGLSLIQRILPNKRNEGEQIGLALYKSRNEWLKNGGSSRLLGFSYRIFGNHRRYFQVEKSKQAA